MADALPTVAAIATAPGAAALAVIRVSGEGALRVADALCGRARILPSTMPGGSFRLFRLRDPEDGSALDEALVLVFRAPRSYTGEDVVEFQVHGGREAPARVLDALLRLGAAPAGPGEFSRRAFLNGRRSLDEAEAVMDLVGAQGRRAARAAAEQLGGALGRRVNAIYDKLTAACADLEATLDFTDEEADSLPDSGGLVARLDAAARDIATLLATAREGRLLREGALVVLSGPPNAGKSTLFNALLGADRAIVAPEAGTTRDSIEETLLLDGLPLRLVDTAGLRDAVGSVEREGVRRARDLASKADLVLRLTPAGSAPDGPGAAIGHAGTDNTEVLDDVQTPPCIDVLSKSDLLDDAGARAALRALGPGAVAASATSPGGLDLLRAAILARLGAGEAGRAHSGAATGVAVAARHAALLREAADFLSKASATLRAFGADAAVQAASDMRRATEALGRITGRAYSEDLLDAVFSRFCVGK